MTIGSLRLPLLRRELDWFPVLGISLFGFGGFRSYCNKYYLLIMIIKYLLSTTATDNLNKNDNHSQRNEYKYNCDDNPCPTPTGSLTPMDWINPIFPAVRAEQTILQCLLAVTEMMLQMKAFPGFVNLSEVYQIIFHTWQLTSQSKYHYQYH